MCTFNTKFNKHLNKHILFTGVIMLFNVVAFSQIGKILNDLINQIPRIGFVLFFLTSFFDYAVLVLLAFNHYVEMMAVEHKVPSVSWPRSDMRQLIISHNLGKIKKKVGKQKWFFSLWDIVSMLYLMHEVIYWNDLPQNL